MALTGTGQALGDAIKTAVDGAADPTDRTELFRAIGTAIIDHMVSNGTAAIAVTSVTLVTAGTAASGPGTGDLV